MTTDYTLLPPNSTPLERALERAMRPGADVQTAVALVRSAKEVLPDGWPIYLVWEYGLEELLPYLPDPRVILDTGLQWQRIKGTPESLRVALAWLGLAAAIEQETPTDYHWFEFQIDPGKLPTRAELENLVGLARLSAPVGTKLSRVFHGYDMRRAIFDETAWSDGTLYSDHSGVYDPALDVDLSFGLTVKSVAELSGVDTASALTLNVVTTAKYDDRQRWDYVSWGDGPPLRNYDAVTRHEMVLVSEDAAPEAQPVGGVITRDQTTEQYGWAESVSWGARTWTEPA